MRTDCTRPSEHQALLEGLLGAAAAPGAGVSARQSRLAGRARAARGGRAARNSTSRCRTRRRPPADVLALLDRVGSPATVATTGGRYFGFVNGGALPASVAANWLASAWDQNAALRVMSPAAAALEDVALEWVRDVLGLPAGLRRRARHRRHAWPTSRRWPPRATRCWRAPAGTSSATACSARRRSRSSSATKSTCRVLKALGLLGLGRERVLRVPVDEQGRMRADALPPLDDRTIVCIQAGNVNTGAFDPAAEICRAGARGRRVGPRRRRVRPVGGGVAALPPPDRRASSARIRGRPTATSGPTSATTAASRSCATPRALRAAMAIAGGVLRARRAARAVAVHARDVAPRARRRGVGGAALARPRRPGRV